jgi:hypothetical protein
MIRLEQRCFRFFFVPRLSYHSFRHFLYLSTRDLSTRPVSISVLIHTAFGAFHRLSVLIVCVRGVPESGISNNCTVHCCVFVKKFLLYVWFSFLAVHNPCLYAVDRTNMCNFEDQLHGIKRGKISSGEGHVVYFMLGVRLDTLRDAMWTSAIIVSSLNEIRTECFPASKSAPSAIDRQT